MPLSAANARRLVHTRHIQLQGYVRDDGQIEVEARMADTKSYSMANQDRSMIAAGEPLHEMRIRMVCTPDEMEITACEASMDATPYSICPQIAPNMARLVGLKIRKGFLSAATQRVGGVEGCTHLRELLQPVATVAYQTRYSLQNLPFNEQAPKVKGEPLGGLINSCHAYAQNSPVVTRAQIHDTKPQE